MQIPLKKNLFEDTRNLNKIRRHFVSVHLFQDSIACLQALVEYADRDTNRALYNVAVTVEATSMGNWSSIVALDSTNWPDQQHVDVSVPQCSGCLYNLECSFKGT